MAETLGEVEMRRQLPEEQIALVRRYGVPKDSTLVGGDDSDLSTNKAHVQPQAKAGDSGGPWRTVEGSRSEA